MSDTERNITVADSKERVALELMQLLLQNNAVVEIKASGSEKDYLDLYRRCRRAVYGRAETDNN